MLAKFGALGGDETVEAARTFWTDPTREHGAAYLRICGPLYTQTPGNMFHGLEMVRNVDMFPHRQHGENQTFDLRSDLARARCPVLVLGGEHDPVCPITGSEEIVSCLPPEFVQFERFEHSGHGVFRDEPERAMHVLREFVCSETPN